MSRKEMITFISAFLVLNGMLFIPVPAKALDVSMDTDLSSANASFWGEGEYSGAGWSVAGAGDVNGDGLDDILIGSPGNSEGGISAGETHLILGKAGGWSMDTNLSNADASFIGEDSYDYSARSVAGAGDVNGDGYDDILIGADWDEDGGYHAGQTYLIFGKASGWAMDTSLSNSDASFIGNGSEHWSGWSVAGTGDVNGDGYDDILIGAPYDDKGGYRAGQTYLVLGRATGWAMDTNLSNVNASFIGEGPQDMAGYSVAGAGDVNSDGYDDILISASLNDQGGDSAGQTYLILGKTSGWAMDTALSSSDASFVGEDGYDKSGWSVTGAGDVNGDGYDDILIGAHWDEDGDYKAGQTYLIFGKAVGWSMDTDLSNSDASFIGEDADDQSGGSVAGAGDVNGDGFADMLIGACYDSDGGTNAGQTYLIMGKASGWAMDTDLSNADASFIGENGGDFSGNAVASAGDVNGDGYADILIGATYNGEGGPYAGQTYLIFPYKNTPPTEISSVKAYSDDAYTFETSTCVHNETIFIELRGTDGDPIGQDTAYVNVRSNGSYPVGFILGLLETGTDTGIYRNNLTIGNKTLEGSRWIEAYTGETVGINSIQDPTKNATVIVGPLRLFPNEDNLDAIEDMAYSQKYWTDDLPGVEWSFETDADWLVWDMIEHTISGIPDNGDVGECWVNIGISLGGGALTDEHDFTVAVENVPPVITTNDVVEAWEDEQYHQDYNSSDDGQGDISWHLDNDAEGWLSIDIDTGELLGNPSNDDVGQYDVNLTVHDGNGGWDGTRFTLTVHNTNDRPYITGEDITNTFEDELYVLTYGVEDADLGDTEFTWALTSDALWLGMNEDDTISGTPTNDDIGVYDVNVSVTDENDGYDYREFKLTVHNTNDPPMWTNVPVSTNLTAGETYTFDVNAIDVDAGDRLTYALTGDSQAIVTIDIDTGLIVWETSEDDVGIHIFNLSVTDGDVTIFHDFTLEVLTNIINLVPISNLISPENDVMLDILNPTFTWTVEDGDGDAVTSDLYIGTSITQVETLATSIRIATDVEGTWYNPTLLLEKGQTYYWTVIPHDGTDIGVCNSGVWTFTVRETAVSYQFPEFINVTVSEGELVSVTIPALDYEPTAFEYSKVEGPDNAEVTPSGLVTWQTAKGDAGIHEIVVEITADYYETLVRINVIVEEGDEPAPDTNNEDEPSDKGWNTMVMAVLVTIIIIIVALVALLLFLKGKKRKIEKEEDAKKKGGALEPDIVVLQQPKAIGPVLDIPAYEKQLGGISTTPVPLGLPSQVGTPETLLLPAVVQQPVTPTPESPLSPEAVQQPVIITTTPLRPAVPEQQHTTQIPQASPPAPLP